MKRMLSILLVGAIVSLPVAAAVAQQAPPVRLRGTIEKVDGNNLTIKARDGSTVMVKLADNARVTAMVKAQLSDIKQGSFIGVTAMPQPDGSQKALEVHIFPEEMRGTGEGHRPYNIPNSTMTNGTAAGATVAGVDGSAMIVKYKDGEKKIVVPPGVPIVRYEIGSSGDLKPGAHFTVLSAVKKPDGTFETNRINVGRDGVVPQ